MANGRHTKKEIGCPKIFVSKQFRFILLTLTFVTVLVWIGFRGSTLFQVNKEPLSAGQSTFFNSQLKDGQPKISTREENDVTMSVLLIIDSTQMKDASDLQNLLTKWKSSQPLLKECNPQTFCRIEVILYDDDEKTSDYTIRQTIISLFSSSNVTSKVVDMIHPVRLRREDAHVISDVIMAEYIAGADYFLILTSACIESGTIIQRNRQELIDKLAAFKPRNVGIINLDKSSKSNLTTGFFVSKTHIEIFGELVPYEIATLPVALKFLSVIYNKELTRILSIESNQYMEQDSRTISAQTLPPKLTSDFMTEQKEFLQRYVKAAETSGDCLRCNIQKSKNVIAMSVYGASPRYTRGALRNAQLLPFIFPGWRLWFYTEGNPKSGQRRTEAIPSEIERRLIELGAEVRYMDVSTSGLAPMLWRFTVIDETDVEIFIIRDCDSRLTTRDVAVVSEWLKTDKPFHCIRDHPSHSNFAVSGGLWGGRTTRLREIFKGGLVQIMKQYGAAYIEDMNFLNRNVWPTVKDNYAFCHDSYSCDKHESSHPFPVVRKDYEHLGEVYDEHSIGRAGDIDILRRAPVNSKCVPSSNNQSITVSTLERS